MEAAVQAVNSSSDPYNMSRHRKRKITNPDGCANIAETGAHYVMRYLTASSFSLISINSLSNRLCPAGIAVGNMGKFYSTMRNRNIVSLLRS